MTTGLSARYSGMKLISVYSRDDRAELLYQLLAERDETVNISHKGMPTFKDHEKFIASHPYEDWCFVCDPEPVGAVYLTKQNEIGVFIFTGSQGKGYAREAIKALMEKHGPRRYLANINPHNEASRFLFSGLGFKLVQQTYEHAA
jgi:RimJ/RimL family protein N-acetyltransferase